MQPEGVPPVGPVPEGSGLKGSPEAEPGEIEEGALAVEPDALPVAGRDPTFLFGSSTLGGTAHARSITGALEQHLDMQPIATGSWWLSLGLKSPAEV